MRSSILALTLVLLGTNAAHAADTKLVAALSRCDATFFDELLQQKDALAEHGIVTPRRNGATFQVPDISHPTESRVFFDKPMKVNGLSLIGYFDELLAYPGGVAVSWGFLVDGSVDNAIDKLRDEIWDNHRIRTSENYYVRSEVWRHAEPLKGWNQEATEPGPPKPGTVERVFMVEPYSGETRFIRAGCSLQGAVTREMIQRLRPDFPLRQSGT